MMQLLKKIAIRVMIGSLIAAALLAVVSVLMGEFSEVFSRAMATIGIVTLHAVACIAYADSMEKDKTKTGTGLRFFQNTILALIIISFFTAIFGVWQIVPGEVIGKLYLTYFIFFFASAHGSALAETTGKTLTIDNIVWANFAFMSFVILMLLPLVWFMNSMEFGDFYYRLLAASGIVDGTLTILAVILHRLYLQKHPEAKSVLFTVAQTKADANGNPVQVQMTPQRKTHPLLWLLAIFIIGQILLSLIGMIVGASMR